MDQVRDGVVDIVWTVAGYTPGRFPRLEVFELPFMPAAATPTSQAIQEYVDTVAADDLKDYKVLAVHVHAPGKIHTKNRLIKSAADLKGLKMRGPTRPITQMLERWAPRQWGCSSESCTISIKRSDRWDGSPLGNYALI